MSSTRHSNSGPRQHGLASDPIYVAAQGIQGTTVTKKAGILSNPQARELVFFLQALSLPRLAGSPNPGGLKRHARDFLKAFPGRVGTPSMHRFGMKPGQIYNADQVRAVRSELYDARLEAGLISHAEDFLNTIGHPDLPGSGTAWKGEGFPLRGEVIQEYFGVDPDREDQLRREDDAPTSYPASLFVQACKQVLDAGIERFLISLCTDPRLVIAAPGQELESATVDPDHLIQQFTDEELRGLCPAELSCFHDVIGALFEFKDQFQKRAASEFAETTIATQVFETLDAGLRLRRIVMVNGKEGIGKSEAMRNWCVRHLGEARYLDLTGINSSKTAFFREIAGALGLPCSESLNTGQLQSRVESMLQLSGLMLCIDEAHFMFKNSERSKAAPEQIDWIDTALCNRGVPVGLSCTPQLITSMQKVSDRARWNSGQFKRRLKRVANLPEKPTLADLEKVARRILPKAPASVYKMAVGYAFSLSEHNLDALVDAITEAKEHARINGRENVTFADLDAALKGTVSAAQLTKNAIFLKPEKAKRGSGQQRVDCNPTAEPLHDDFAEESAPDQSRLKPARNEAGLVPI